MKNNDVNDLKLSAEEIDYILSPQAVRERAEKIFELSLQKKTNFTFHPEKIKPTVEYVLEVIHKNYPSLKVPFHSRWGHFRAGNVDRPQEFKNRLTAMDALEKARCQLDLVITSVLLDAGAGPDWSYFEEKTKKSFKRSEGLGLASYHMFCAGVMCSDRSSLKADLQGLKNVTLTDLKNHFQVSEKNPLLGLSGRLLLLNNLAQALENKTIFSQGRPGNLIDYLSQKYGKTIPAPALLRSVLDGLGSIWPGRLSAAGMNLGDVWSHSKMAQPGTFQSLVPLHKLSQWLSYSMIEPIVEAGFTISEMDALTGLAEYRNGGLMLDMEILTVNNPEHLSRTWPPESDLIIEWRALTVHLLDLIGVEVQKALKKTPQEFPLAQVLEGGTWWAGRFLAEKKRAGAEPPLNITSDGTVF